MKNNQELNAKIINANEKERIFLINVGHHHDEESINHFEHAVDCLL